MATFFYTVYMATLFHIYSMRLLFVSILWSYFALHIVYYVATLFIYILCGYFVQHIFYRATLFYIPHGYSVYLYSTWLFCSPSSLHGYSVYIYTTWLLCASYILCLPCSPFTTSNTALISQFLPQAFFYFNTEFPSTQFQRP